MACWLAALPALEKPRFTGPELLEVSRGGYGRLKGNQDVLNVGIRLSRDKKPFQGVQS